MKITNILFFLKKNYFYILAFIFFLIINYLSPPIYDDWSNPDFLNIYEGSVFSLVTYGIYSFWREMNGRAVSNIIVILLTYFNFIWNILSAVIFVFIILVFNQHHKNKNSKFTIPLSFLLLVSISKGIRVETYLHISANVMFIFAFGITLLFYLLINKNIINKNYSWQIYFLFLIMSFTLGSWVENLGTGFSASLFLANILFYIKNKKINYLLFTCFITSFLGLLFLFTSPGMRSTRHLSNGINDLMFTFKHSFVENINLILYQNKFIFAILTLSSLLLITTNKIKFKIKLIKSLYLSLLLFVFLVFFLFLMSPYVSGQLDFIYHLITKHLFNNQIITSVFWFFIILSFGFPINYMKNNQQLAFFTYLYANFSLLPVFFISQIGNRIIAVPVICYAMLSVLFFSQIIINQNKLWRVGFYILIFAVFNRATNWLFIYTSINRVQINRELIIKEAIILQNLKKWDYEKDTIIMPKFEKKHVLFDGVIRKDDFHYQPFLKYYHLNQDTKVIFE
jgi:hypothetical protein